MKKDAGAVQLKYWTVLFLSWSKILEDSEVDGELWSLTARHVYSDPSLSASWNFLVSIAGQDTLMLSQGNHARSKVSN